MKHVRHLEISNAAKPVLIFDHTGTLMSVCRSVTAAGELTMITPQAISSSCGGRTISSGGLCFRHLDASLIIESSDLGQLTIEEYDEAAGLNKPYKLPATLKRERDNFTKRIIRQ